jgi:hypothetical protein
MNTQSLLQWQNLIFLLPLCVAALLLLLSSLKLGHRGGHHHPGGHAPAHPHPVGAGHAAPHAPVHAPGPASGHVGHHSPSGHHHPGGQVARHPHPSAPNGKHAPAGAGEGNGKGDDRPHVSVTTNFIWHLTGADRAPLMMIVEAFLMIWGICGLWANRLVLQGAQEPSPSKILAVLGIALVGGALGARIAATLIARILPRDETLVVSRDSLFGLVGTVAFPVSAEAGRIHVYDEYGTLHDETCRITPGHTAILKGRQAIVLDMDLKGRLIVEEVSDTTLR